MFSINYLIFYIVVFVANIIQCITGFAGTVLAMPFSTMLIGYVNARPMLNVVGIIASIGVLIIGYKYVNIKVWIFTCVAMFAGMIPGFLLRDALMSKEDILLKILGVVVIIFAIYNAYESFFSKHKDDEKERHPIIDLFVIILSGVIHGMFVCGGPLLVTAMTRKVKDKREFISTMSAIWIVLNSIVMFTDIGNKSLNQSLVLPLIACAIVLIAAVFIGHFMAYKMPKNAFLILSYILMVISGVSLIV